MRVKKQRRHRKVVRFYAACFGFREPYKVVMDGTFVHHLILHRLLPADDALRRLLAARALLFTSKCVVAELRRLGESFSEAFEAAQQLVTARCEHEKVVNAAECISSLVGEKNLEHFFVATQDADLRRKLREVPGVPVIYGLKNSLFLEQPSTHQREFAQFDEEKRSHMSTSEYEKLVKGASLVGKTGDHETGSDEEQTGRPARFHIEKALHAGEKAKFKRNRAKGPNPLSCKKKKPKPGSSVIQNQEEAKTDGSGKRKRVRKRKRSHKDSKPAENVS